jgi:hypothetical protein
LEKVVQYFEDICDLRICGFASCGPALRRNLLICDCGMNPGIAICGLLKEVCLPTSALFIGMQTYLPSIYFLEIDS